MEVVGYWGRNRKNHLTSLSARDWISENDGERGNSDDF